MDWGMGGYGYRIQENPCYIKLSSEEKNSLEKDKKKKNC